MLAEPKAEAEKDIEKIIIHSGTCKYHACLCLLYLLTITPVHQVLEKYIR